MAAFTIATWNLQRPISTARARRQRLDKWFAEIRADIWVLTETHASVTPCDALESATTMETDRPHEAGEAWTAIWSRFPLTPIPTFADPARVVAARIAPPERRPVVVYGTVLPWLGNGWRGIPAVDGQAYLAALDAQTSEWRRLQAEHPDCDFVVAGDLNQDLAPKHHYGSRRVRAALHLALEKAGLVCLTAGTLDPVFQQTHGEWATIDHICANRRLVEAGHRARAWPDGDRPDRRLSDHFGLAVEVFDA